MEGAGTTGPMTQHTSCTCVLGELDVQVPSDFSAFSSCFFLYLFVRKKSVILFLFSSDLLRGQGRSQAEKLGGDRRVWSCWPILIIQCNVSPDGGRVYVRQRTQRRGQKREKEREGIRLRGAKGSVFKKGRPRNDYSTIELSGRDPTDVTRYPCHFILPDSLFFLFLIQYSLFRCTLRRED